MRKYYSGFFWWDSAFLGTMTRYFCAMRICTVRLETGQEMYAVEIEINLSDQLRVIVRELVWDPIVPPNCKQWPDEPWWAAAG
jgi:hypothetical protein